MLTIEISEDMTNARKSNESPSLWEARGGVLPVTKSGQAEKKAFNLAQTRPNHCARRNVRLEAQLHAADLERIAI